jgi:hypothetical protein
MRFSPWPWGVCNGYARKQSLPLIETLVRGEGDYDVTGVARAVGVERIRYVGDDSFVDKMLSSAWCLRQRYVRGGFDRQSPPINGMPLGDSPVISHSARLFSNRFRLLQIERRRAH